MLRTTREGPLPGQTLALLDAQTELVVELVPCECGHAQERSLLPTLLERVRADTVLVADRNFCTVMPLWEQFLFSLFRRGAFFVIRQHASTLSYCFEGGRRKTGHCETGLLYEQTLILTDHDATGDEQLERKIRRITLVLDTPTQKGDGEIHLLTSLPPKVTATRIAETYRLRWTITPRVTSKVGLSNVDGRPALRSRNAGVSQGRTVFVRDGRLGMERLRRGPGGSPLGSWRTEDRQRTLGRTFPSGCGQHADRHEHRC